MEASVIGDNTGLQSELDESVRIKIKTISELPPFIREKRNSGKSVVLAHGVFDLMHIGHIRHLEAAKKEGDILIVSITGDGYVSKGPERPVFKETLRAEAVAALSYVDWVVINHATTAEHVINVLRPNVYVKGAEYADASKDITGNITLEKKLVNSYGGRLEFTDDITFSSSSLINQHTDFYELSLKDYLSSLRNQGTKERIFEFIEEIAEYKVLLVGDAIIDEYQYVKSLGKTPKENLIATLSTGCELFAGGVIASANHMAEFCKEIEIICAIGEGENGFESFIRGNLKGNVTLTPIIRPDIPTTRKCRYIDTGYGMRKLFEVYFMDDHPLLGELENDLISLIGKKTKGADAVIVTDFGHGLIGRRAIDELVQKRNFLCVNAQSNSANHGFNLITKYPRADYICMDQPEARLAVQENHSTIEKVVGQLLPLKVQCPRIVVTTSKNGCVTYSHEEGLSASPALTSSIIDTVGAGDAFYSLSALFVKAGATMEEIGFVGNVAGAIKVGIVGHRQSVEKTVFKKFVTALLQ